MAEGSTGECALYQFGLVFVGLVVGVDERCLEVTVAHPLLEGPEGYADGSHSGSEGVAQVMKADALQTSPLCGGLEALEKARPVERVTGVRVAEDQVVVMLILAALEVAFEFAGDLIGQRDRPGRAARLRGAKLSADEASPDSNSACGPVDVLPAKGEQFSLAQASHGAGQIDRAFCRTTRIVGDRGEESVDFGGVEEANIRRRCGPVGLVDRGDGVRRREAPPLREGEDGVEQAEVIEDALGGLSLTTLGGEDEPFDSARRDLVERRVAEERPEMDPQVGSGIPRSSTASYPGNRGGRSAVAVCARPGRG
jgi:hypothetical protein